MVENAGVELILYPEQNQEDIELIKKNNPQLLENIKIKSVNSIWQILDICLSKNNLQFNKYLESQFRIS